ncbi:hypothetical protein FGE12_25945 [Aggregicoccus sp. 17bor-14]|uniref:hypothetical protein n=1 Tax=Myxococcaceae TaxID=31 RepID=UPI00129C5B54|nr:MULTISPECIES: hypothetical protein [Myxococcaceae]MBF5045879.1 hypothetical protein [Simulacricoccus sp. 17bor-14]MRI91613.1 hypothetical protein [Aggregicoccus sp. 17bor-14]
MLAPLLTLSLLAAAPAEPSLKLAAPGFSCVDAEAKACDFFNDYFAQQLAAEAHARVTTKTEVSALLGFERQKQLLGCSEESSSCLAEIAGALGVDGVLVGSVATFGKELALTVKVVGAKDGEPLASWSTRARKDGVLDALGEGARAIARQLRPAGAPLAAAPAVQAPPAQAPDAALALSSAPASSGAPSTLRSRAWIPAAAGGALLAGGGAFYALARSQKAELQKPDVVRTTAQLDALVSGGKRNQTVGFALMGAGAAGLATGAGLYLLAPRAPARVAVVPTGHGGALVLGGSLP